MQMQVGEKATLDITRYVVHISVPACLLHGPGLTREPATTATAAGKHDAPPRSILSVWH